MIRALLLIALILLASTLDYQDQAGIAEDWATFDNNLRGIEKCVR